MLLLGYSSRHFYCIATIQTKSSQIPLKNLPMVGTTLVGHIHIMIIEFITKLDAIPKNVGCTVAKMLDQNSGDEN